MTFYPLRGALYIEVKGGKKHSVDNILLHHRLWHHHHYCCHRGWPVVPEAEHLYVCVLLSSPCMCWAVGGWEWCTETTVLSDEKEGRAAQSGSGFAGERLLVCRAQGRCMAVAFVTVILWLVCARVCARERERDIKGKGDRNWSGWKKEKLLPQGSHTFILRRESKI